MNRTSKIGIVLCCLGILISGGVLTYLNFFANKTNETSTLTSVASKDETEIAVEQGAENQFESNQVISTDNFVLESDNLVSGSNSSINETGINIEEIDSSTEKVFASILFVAEDGFLSTNPVFGGMYTGKIEKLVDNVANNLDSNVSELAITSENSDTDSIAISSTTSTSSIVSTESQAVFADAIVYVDSEPSLVVIDKATSSIVRKVPSPVFPGSFVSALSDENGNALFVCDGRDGYQYYWTFSKSESETVIESEETIESEVAIETESINKMFTSDQKKILSSYLNNEPGFASRISVLPELASNILYKLRNWQGELFSGVIPPLQVAVYGKQIPIAETSFFVLVPETQGTHILGICDKDGKWISARAFTAVFTESGEFRSVSFDYVADRPQVTLHLSDNEIYYVVTGVLDSYMTDSEDTSSESESILSDGERTSSDKEQLYFTVKKAP